MKLRLLYGLLVSSCFVFDLAALDVASFKIADLIVDAQKLSVDKKFDDAKKKLGDLLANLQKEKDLASKDPTRAADASLLDAEIKKVQPELAKIEDAMKGQKVVPVTQQPVTQQPVTQQPVTQQPVTQQPVLSGVVGEVKAYCDKSKAADNQEAIQMLCFDGKGDPAVVDCGARKLKGGFFIDTDKACYSTAIDALRNVAYYNHAKDMGQGGGRVPSYNQPEAIKAAVDWRSLEEVIKKQGTAAGDAQKPVETQAVPVQQPVK